MNRFVTALAFLALLIGVATPAQAQIKDVNVRQINAIPQDSVNALIADGAAVTLDQIEARIFANADVARNDTVRFTAVVMSNPKNSGLSSFRDDIGGPTRVHVFVRDTSAALLGPEGMGIQIVDSGWQTSGTGNLLVGDVVDVVARVAPFNQTMQIDSPISITPIGGLADFNLPESMMDPIAVATSDINVSVGASGEVQPNWAMLADLRGSLVRLEGASILARDLSNTDRPGWAVTSDAGTTSLGIRDISLRFRNDRSNYTDDFNVRNDDFIPPSPGSVVNLEGFLLIEVFSNVTTNVPTALQISPMEDSDLEVTVAAPQVLLDALSEIPGADPFDVTATVSADPTRTLTSVTVSYFSTAASDTVTVAATNSVGNTWTAPIPSPGDGEFVTYWFTAVDNVDTENRSPDSSYKVLNAGITTIADIQRTADDGEGPSPFAGLTSAMNITAVVMSDPATSGFFSVQTSETLDPWTGVVLRNVSGLKRGNTINITEATIEESFGLTRLDDVVFTVVDTTTASFDYKVVPTSVLIDPAIAEAHESMMLQFDAVTIVSNDEGFGEFLISSDGTLENGVLVDDASDAIDGGLGVSFENGNTISFVRGLLTYSFGDFKLLPEDASDLGDVNVGVEDIVFADGLALEQNFPNPFATNTTISYTVDESSVVSLVVYDVLGREVRTLVNNVVPAGRHSASFDASGLGSGMYLYRLNVGGESATRSMLLSR